MGKLAFLSVLSDKGWETVGSVVKWTLISAGVLVGGLALANLGAYAITVGSLKGAQSPPRLRRLPPVKIL